MGSTPYSVHRKLKGQLFVYLRVVIPIMRRPVLLRLGTVSIFYFFWRAEAPSRPQWPATLFQVLGFGRSYLLITGGAASAQEILTF